MGTALSNLFIDPTTLYGGKNCARPTNDSLLAFESCSDLDRGYGFVQAVCLLCIYGYVLSSACNLISDGSELLLLLPRLDWNIGASRARVCAGRLLGHFLRDWSQGHRGETDLCRHWWPRWLVHHAVDDTMVRFRRGWQSRSRPGRPASLPEAGRRPSERISKLAAQKKVMNSHGEKTLGVTARWSDMLE
eukprot:m.395933 g.395933  ORF g.395933 m.395933 type:complete len:190 (-) comp56403_c1_seq6:46-615(-)